MHDYSFALQYHLTMLGDTDNDSDLVFPKFGKLAMKEREEDLDSRVSQLWTTCFEELVKVYDSYHELFQEQLGSGVVPVIGHINKKLTSHHGKKAANMAMADSSSAGLPQIFCTGWEVHTLHTLFDYVVGTAKMSRTATKNQNRWHFLGPDGNIIGGYPPEIKDITIDCEKICHFMAVLFGGGHGFDTIIGFLQRTLHPRACGKSYLHGALSTQPLLCSSRRMVSLGSIDIWVPLGRQHGTKHNLDPPFAPKQSPSREES
jgi:hypothetical protein